MRTNFPMAFTLRACAAGVAAASLSASPTPVRGESGAQERDRVEAIPTAQLDIYSTRIDPSERSASTIRPAPRRTAPHLPAPRGGGGAAYDFFDGFETYDLGPFDGQLVNAPFGVNDVFSQEYVVVANTMAEGLPPGRDPLGTGDAQHIKNARGETGEFSETSQSEWRIHFDRLFVFTSERELIVCADFYFPDLETLDSWETVSFTEGFITSRIFQAGRFDHLLTSATGGTLTRPAMLGTTDGLGFGQFWAPPLDTGTGGALAPFTTRTGEWFSIAVRLSVGPVQYSIWIRDGQTDGSNGVLIEDPSSLPLLESGWYRLFPGRQAVETAPGVWTGYGLAINAFSQTAPQQTSIPSASTIDAVRSHWFPNVAVPDDPEWAPTNRHMNNISILGDSFTPAPLPKQRLPYKDDFELYPKGSRPSPVLLPAWTTARDDVVVAFGTFKGASVNTTPPPGSDGSGSPEKSMGHRNINTSGMRTPTPMMWTATPVRKWRPWAVEGDSVRVGANFRLVGTGVTRFGLSVVDQDVEGAAESLLFGVNAPVERGGPDLRHHIRRVNPLFDPGAEVEEADYFDGPLLGVNTPHLNYPTTTAVLFGTEFFNTELTLFGDGTASWSVDGAPLEIDPAFAVSDPVILEELQTARLIETEGATDAPPYTRFLSDVRTFDTVEVWSDNEPFGFNERLFIDDLCIEGPARQPGPGPGFELPYVDDFSQYAIDQPVAGQGQTPFSTAGTDGQWLLLTEADAKKAPEQLYCRYQITAIEQEPDHSMGGILFDCPEGWIVDAIAAIPAVEGEGCATQDRFRILNEEECLTCIGMWMQLSSEPEEAISGDLLTHTQIRVPTPRWADLIHDGTSATSGVRGDGEIKDASAQTPAARGVDPFGERGNVLSFVNTGFLPAGPALGQLQSHLTLPEIIVEEIDLDAKVGARSAALHWDVYLQDPYTRPIFIARGPRFNIADGSLSTDAQNYVAGVRLGGPTLANDDFDDGEIAVLVGVPGMLGFPAHHVWEGVGVTAPTGSWVRIRLDVERAGDTTTTWRLGMNTSGLVGGPGGPVEFGGDGMGDRPGHFDHTLPGAHQDAVHLATGSAAVIPSTSLTHPLGVNALEFRQGFDTSGAPGNPNNPGGAPSRWWVDQIHLEEVLSDPPPPPCPWDLTGSGTIGSADIGYLLGCWGVLIAPSCAIADITSSGAVGSADLAQILGNWGPCP